MEPQRPPGPSRTRPSSRKPFEMPLGAALGALRGEKKFIGCLLGASWREKLIVCKLPGGARGSPRGSWRASREAFGSSFSSLL